MRQTPPRSIYTACAEACAEAQRTGHHELLIKGLNQSQALAAQNAMRGALMDHAPKPMTQEFLDALLDPPLWNAAQQGLSMLIPPLANPQGALASMQRSLKKQVDNDKPDPSDQRPETIYVVVGAARSVGDAYKKALEAEPDCMNGKPYGAYLKDKTGTHVSKVIGVSRTGEAKELLDKRILQADIGQTQGTDFLYRTLRDVALARGSRGPLRIVLLYTVGPFEYQGDPALGDKAAPPDPKVFDLNFVRYKEMADIVNEIAKERKHRYGSDVQVDLVGLSTKALVREDSTLFPGYAASKHLMENFIENFTRRPDDGVVRSGLTLRTSTLYTPSEGDMRLLAYDDDKKYWITPPELVEKTLPAITGMKPGEYHCIDVYKEKPDFDPGMHEAGTARNKWERETNKSGTDGANTEDPALASSDASLHTHWRKLRERDPAKPPTGTISWKL